MSKQEKETITDLKKCNFTEIDEYFKVKVEERKNMSKEQKLVGCVVSCFFHLVQIQKM